MTTSRSRTLYHTFLVALAFLALRPVGPLNGLLGALLTPAELLVHLASPLTWIEGRPALASTGSHSDVGTGAWLDAAQQALEDAVLSSAEPQQERLRSQPGRPWRGEVIGRMRNNRDRIWIQTNAVANFRTGDPVVSGDSFVGIVDMEATRLGARGPGVVQVHLVTGPAFRVGGEILPDDAAAAGLAPRSRRMVVGGLSPHPDRILLDVHNPEQTSGAGAHVVVRESERIDRRTHLANGFILGRLEFGVPESWAQRGGRLATDAVLGISSTLDFDHGLHQVLILTSGGASPGDTLGDRQPIRGVSSVQSQEAWVPARRLLGGDSSILRQSGKLDCGQLDGVKLGAAVAQDMRFLGRVTRAGIFGSDLALLADRGLRVSAIAYVDPQDAPLGKPHTHVLGELVSLGPDPTESRSGESEPTVLLHWSATLPLGAQQLRAGEPALPVTLWTGSGEEGVPRGLLLGETDLPLGPGPHVLRVRPVPGVHDSGPLHVWVGLDSQGRNEPIPVTEGQQP